MNIKVLNEGGVAGHLNHTWEILSKEQLFDFYDKLFKGELDASEKVDGVNLFVGYNEAGKLTFARNKTEQPSTNIEQKFNLEHPGGDSFRAGFKALQQGFEKLSIEDRYKAGLIDENNKPKSFINLEIIYGEIPNLIQYSSINSFIVFHSMVGTYETKYQPLFESKDILKKHLNLSYKGWGIYKDKNDNSFKWSETDKKYIRLNRRDVLPTIKQRLDFLANKIKEETVVSDVVYYFGEIGNVDRVVKKETSHWIFKSQIHIPIDKIKKDLDTIANKWKAFPEVKELQNPNLSFEDETTLKKSLTTKISSEILVNLSSTLFKGDRKTSETHPKIEGLVIPYNNSVVKITGDFAQLNQDMWKPLKDGLDVILTSFINKTFQEELNISDVKVITKQSWTSKLVNSSAKNYLQLKNKTFYKNEQSFYDKINKMRVTNNINIAIDKLSNEMIKIDNKNIKKNQIIKALKIASYKLQLLKNSISDSDDRITFLNKIVKILFNL